jgi:opacity protein-like surface antigen
MLPAETETFRGSIKPMKPRTALTAFLTLASPSLLMAGEAETTQTSTYQAPPSMTSQHQGLFIGAGADYMFDAEEVFYNGHIGYDFGNGSSLFLESGWLGQDDRGANFLFPLGSDVDIVPVTVNFKHEFMFTDTFGLYLGLGAGAANVDVTTGPFSDDDWALTAQAFAGLVYNVSPTFEIYAGVRYMWLDDVDLGGASFDDLDDVGVGAGIRFNF